jgi:GxxExxY protein
MQSGLAHGVVTEAIIGAVELRKRGLDAVTESRMEVRYKGEVVGTYSADMVVNETVIVELKVAEEYRKADEAQLINELVATGKPVGLLINFGRRKVEFKRLVWNLKG